MNRKIIISEYRDIIIKGKCIDLVPLKEEHFIDLIRIRNQVKNKYFLNQTINLTLDMQSKWYEEYLKRDNDIYWVIMNKSGVLVGTNRLYNIDGNIGEQGSFMIDEAYSMGPPYALEGFVLSLEFAFDKLELNEIINEDRCDNKMMNSISKKIGFRFVKEVEIRDVKFNKYILYKHDNNLQKYKNILNDFMEE